MTYTPQYDASVHSIIKFTTNSKALEGLTANARSTWYQNRHSSWIEQLDLRYNAKRWTVYDNLKYNADNDITWKDLTQTIYADAIWREVSAEREYRQQRKLTNNLGIDYKIAEGNYIGGRYSLTYNFRNDIDLCSTNNITADAEHYDLLRTTGEEHGHKRPKHLFNVYYSGSFSGYTLNADVDYIISSAVKDNEYAELSELKDNRTFDALSDVKNKMLSIRASIGHKLFGGNATIGM